MHSVTMAAMMLTNFIGSPIEFGCTIFIVHSISSYVFAATPGGEEGSACSNRVWNGVRFFSCCYSNKHTLTRINTVQCTVADCFKFLNKIPFFWIITNVHAYGKQARRSLHGSDGKEPNYILLIK